MALARSGQGEEAMQIEKDHILINGEVPDSAMRVTLGMAYYVNGKKKEAREEWDAAKNGTNQEARTLATEFEEKYP